MEVGKDFLVRENQDSTRASYWYNNNYSMFYYNLSSIMNVTGLKCIQVIYAIVSRNMNMRLLA
jgi:hypothetical protein